MFVIKRGESTRPNAPSAEQTPRLARPLPCTHLRISCRPRGTMQLAPCCRGHATRSIRSAFTPTLSNPSSLSFRPRWPQGAGALRQDHLARQEARVRPPRDRRSRKPTSPPRRLQMFAQLIFSGPPITFPEAARLHTPFQRRRGPARQRSVAFSLPPARSRAGAMALGRRGRHRAPGTVSKGRVDCAFCDRNAIPQPGSARDWVVGPGSWQGDAYHRCMIRGTLCPGGLGPGPGAEGLRLAG